MKDIAIKYCDFCRNQRGMADGTIYNYHTVIARFIDFIKEKKITIHHLKIIDIDKFIIKNSLKIGKSGINSIYSALRSFLKYLYLFDYLRTDLSKQLSLPRTYSNRHIPKYIPWEYMYHILKAVNRTTIPGKRLFAILLLFMTYGLRPKEVSQLTLSDINWSKKQITILHRKTDDNLVLPLTQEVAQAILIYLAVRPNTLTKELFVTTKSPYRHLSSQCLRHIIVTHLATLSIKLPLKGAYLFRYSLAKKLLDEGATIVDIASILGHKCLTSTMRYLTIDIQKLKEVSDNYANLL